MTYVGNECGMKMLAATLFKDAIIEGNESFLNNDNLGYLVSYCVQKATCNSYDGLKRIIKKSYSLQQQRFEIDLTQITNDAASMTINELSEKYNRPSQSIRNYLVRHNIPYVKASVKGIRENNWDQVESELLKLNGLYSIDELIHMKGYIFYGSNYNTLKCFCDNRNIPYKGKINDENE